jgi:two-component system CheB/CheR fusion protein
MPGNRRDTEDPTDPAFEALLDYLKRSRGFDFTGYKRGTLQRRVSKRIGEVGVPHCAEYLDYLEVHPEEFAFLFDTILINVTAFFRDAPAWEYLASDVIPRIIASKKPNEPIRVWSAGCASGEEPYTLTMLLAEALGTSAFRQRVKIYATDVDEGTLTSARRAIYDARAVESVPPELLGKYFEHTNTHYAFRPDLRRSVIFGRHDLVQDAPISKLDLLVCRNVLMYMNAETQGRILARLHFALAPTGYLFLGKAEMLLSRADLFTPVDLKQRIFAKVPKIGVHDRLVVLTETGDSMAEAELADEMRVRDAAFEAAPMAQLLIDAGGNLALANRAAQDAFGLTAADLGRPLRDLEVSYRPLELRSLIDQAHQEGRAVASSGVTRPLPSGESEQFDVQIAPLRDAAGNALGTSISFEDTTTRARMEEELRRVHAEVEQSNEELQSTNEELETTNEELQSTNEELETTNEELQSGNEELETMNEELQSTNEELRSMNDQLHARTQELNRTNAFLEAVLAAIPAAVVVVDPDLTVRVWRERAEALWGLRPEEVDGVSLLKLDIGLPVAPLEKPVRACLDGEPDPGPLVLDATDRRGRKLRCTVTCTPLRDDHSVQGVILLMETGDPIGHTAPRDPTSGGSLR